MAGAADGVTHIVKYHDDFEDDASLVLTETDFLNRLSFDPLGYQVSRGRLGSHHPVHRIEHVRSQHPAASARHLADLRKIRPPGSSPALVCVHAFIERRATGDARTLGNYAADARVQSVRR
ncbi:hypothetical protein V1273_003700 [Bradyrhizobium sp. AZCC 1721]